MSPSLELRSLIDQAKAEVKVSPDGELRLPQREALWTVIASSAGDDLSARTLLTALDAACVRQVMNIWWRVFPHDDGPSRMLDLARAVLAGAVPEAQARRIRDDFYVDAVDDREYRPEDYPAMDVAQAATRTVATALVGKPYDAEEADLQDADEDPEDLDTSYLAACAYSGGPLGRHDPAARRDFWLWYLETAIPEALRAA